ncbi:hypothetical protein PF005_g10841 [Phytophthora fragariae]|uniref:OTU domain-containing protein n=1 Tax=Phytophthora fragariae TaxID=53985 RepID=A0A6A3Y449_9STRA|nr:hypothetical protein PF005_g10841 [Phytophthora fragariae]
MQHQPGPPPGSEEAPPPPDEGPPPNEEPPPSWDLLSLAQPREDTPEREACDDKERQRHTGQGKQQRDKQERPSKGSKGIAATQDSIVAETQPSQDPEQEGMTDVAEGDPAATPGRGQQATTEDPRSSGQTRPTDERGSTGEERHRDEPPVSDPQQPVTPEEMFNALVEDMRASPAIGQVEAWRATMRELFAKVYLAVPVQRAVVPAERQRFPKLTGAEVSALLTLFEQTYVADAGTYADWNKLATAISHELLSTKWAFNEIVRKLSSRLKWTKAPVLNQWVQTVTQEAQPRREQGPTPPPPVFEAFMFDPDTYSAAEAKKLRTICVKPKDRTRGTRLREGTDAEWKIIGGMTDGSIACRKLPVFIKQVLDAQERLRLHSTIQAQVEGELVLHLIRNRGVRSTFQQKTGQTHGAFQALAEDSDADEDEAESEDKQQPAAVQPDGIIEISSGEASATDDPQTPTQIAHDETTKKASEVRGAAPNWTTPVLMTKKRQERATLLAQKQRVNVAKYELLPLGSTSTADPQSVQEFEEELGVREVATPTTGNCMTMAVAQAYADAALEGSDEPLSQLTASIKRGVKYAGLLHLEDQLVHDLRQNALAHVRRNWKCMTRRESLNQFKWFLEDYANSASGRDDLVSDDTWGGSDLMGMAANFVNQDIYVIGRGESSADTWECRRYRPATISRAGRVIETATEHPLSIRECMDEIRVSKIESSRKLSMIVRFWGRHYSAFVHRGDARNFPEGAAEAEATAAAPKDDNQKESEEEKGWGNTDARPTPSPPAEEERRVDERGLTGAMGPRDMERRR